MSTLELHKREKNPSLIWNAARYYDHPDGEDLLGKLSFTLKNSAAFATIWGAIYSNATPKTDNVGKLFKIAKCTLPGVAMGFTFTCVTFCSTVLRGKDDGLNHGLGGMAAGLILGPATGIPGLSTAGALLLGGVASLNKNLNMRGFYMGGNVYRKYHSPYYKKALDFSKIPEIKGNWTRDP